MSAIRAAVAAEAAELEPGDTVRVVCPACGGGRSRERSMSITAAEDGAVLFLCYRASCGARGAIGGSPTRIANLVRTRQRKYKVKEDPSYRFVEFMGPPYPCMGEVEHYELEDFGCAWDPETGRLAMPVYSPVGRVRGWVLRALDGRLPKTLAVPTAAEPQLGWNKTYRNPEQVVVVEDIPSAIRLGEFGVRAVSLLGTHMTEEAKDELIQEATDVAFALDRDAYAKAQGLARDMRIHFRECTAVLLPKDFKDQTDEEVMGCLTYGVSWLRLSNPERRMSE